MAPIQIAEFFNLSVFGGSIFHDRLQLLFKIEKINELLEILEKKNDAFNEPMICENAAAEKEQLEAEENAKINSDAKNARLLQAAAKTERLKAKQEQTKGDEEYARSLIAKDVAAEKERLKSEKKPQTNRDAAEAVNEQAKLEAEKNAQTKLDAEYARALQENYNNE